MSVWGCCASLSIDLGVWLNLLMRPDGITKALAVIIAYNQIASLVSIQITFLLMLRLCVDDICSCLNAINTENTSLNAPCIAQLVHMQRSWQSPMSRCCLSRHNPVNMVISSRAKRNVWG